MNEHPRLKARIAGLLYLVNVAAGMFAEPFVRARLVVSGDAAATASNILGSQTLYRAAFAAEILAMICEVGLALLFYELFKPVNRSAAALVAFFRLVWAAIFALVSLFHIAPLYLLGGAPYLSAFTPAQLQALSLLSLKLHGVGYNVGLVFFGVECLLLGWLILRSTFLPRVLGALMAIAGLCYLVNSFTAFLAPPIAGMLFPYILIPAFPAELGLTLWLLIVGLNPAKWSALSRSQEERQ
jgi:hypothetical protein